MGLSLKGWKIASGGLYKKHSIVSDQIPSNMMPSLPYTILPTRLRDNKNNIVLLPH